MDTSTLFTGIENLGWAMMIPLKIAQIAFSIIWDSNLYILFCIIVLVAYLVGDTIGELSHGAAATMASSIVIVQGYLALGISLVSAAIIAAIGWIPGAGWVASGVTTVVQYLASFMTEYVLDIVSTVIIGLLFLPIIIFSTVLTANSTWFGVLAVGTVGAWADNAFLFIPMIGPLLSQIAKYVPLYLATWLISFLSGGGCLYPRTNYLCNFARARNISWLERFSLKSQKVFSYHPAWLFRFSWKIEQKKRKVYAAVRSRLR